MACELAVYASHPKFIPRARKTRFRLLARLYRGVQGNGKRFQSVSSYPPFLGLYRDAMKETHPTHIKIRSPNWLDNIPLPWQKRLMKNTLLDTTGLLHRKLQAILCEKIYSGEYPDGALIPTERELATHFKMSRVTVRSTLASMEAEGLISRRQGHGTRVTLRTAGHPCIVDLIAVVAPAQNPFFASFIRYFEEAAVAHDALVVFRQAAVHTVVDSLFDFYRRSIRNIVVWPYDESIDTAKLARLRGLGMNLVFFDRLVDSPSVDSVSVDNAHGVKMLFEHLRSRGAQRIACVGWQNEALTSNRDREAAFLRITEQDGLYRLPWNQERDVDTEVGALLAEIGPRHDALLCGNGVIGIAVKRYVVEHRLPVSVACMDDLPGADELGLTTYSQPMDRLAGMAYRRLIAQAENAAAWKAKMYLLKGNLRVRDWSGARAPGDARGS